MRPSAKRLLNILVPVKRAVDFSVRIRVNPQQTGIDTNVKHSMNPFDEIAVEEAVRLRERHKDAVKSIQAVTIGPSKSVDILRTALALGADSAIHVQIPDSAPSPEPLAVAKTLCAIIENKNKQIPEQPIDLVIMGKQAIDDDLGVTGQMLAGLLGWGQATFASKLDINDAQKEAVVTREIDGGGEEIRCKLPLVVTTDLRLNGESDIAFQRQPNPLTKEPEPRYASLPNIMKAKKKPIEKFVPEDLGVDFTPQIETVKVTEPPSRVGGVKVANVDELIGKLKEAGIL